MPLELFFMIGFVAIVVFAYAIGRYHGNKDSNRGNREEIWTAFVVVGLIAVVIGIAYAVSLDMWQNKGKTRLILGILTVLILSGSLGGLIGNYYRKQTLSPEEKNIDLLVSVLLGIGASLLVPVLLHILTSNLLKEIGPNPEKAFILAGFCLAAAISAEAFIERMISSFNKMGDGTSAQNKALEVDNDNKETK